MENLFFELIQLAIGTRTELSRTLSDTEWTRVYEMAKKQALLGICFVGCQRLPSELRPPELLWLQWLGMAAKIQQKNHLLNEECARVCREFWHDGVQCVVLKGQSNLIYYPEEMRDARIAGDIDLWCSVPDGVEVAHEVNGVLEKREYRGVEGVIEYCKQYERCQGREIPWHRVLYYHCELTSPSGIGIEPHYRPTYLCSPIHNRRLQNWFAEFHLSSFNSFQLSRECHFPVPSVSFNAVYQLLHMFKHLFEGGIGLRQLLDYYFVLKTLASFLHREVMHTLCQFGMKKFAGAVMYVLQSVFDMPDEYLICKPNVKEGDFLLSEIMMAGNFGQYDPRIIHNSQSIIHNWEKLKHNSRLLTHYPEEVLCEPFFRVYHWMWRKLELWR